jgi:HAD superfamily hydrolase (TIGR01484 family)
MSGPSIKVVAIDVDGTLLDGDHQLRDAVKDSLYELAARNMHVVLATARGPQALNPVLRPLQFSPLLVCFSGARVGEIDRQSLAPWKVMLEKRHSLSVARSIVATALDHNVEPHVLTAKTWRTRKMSPETARMPAYGVSSDDYFGSLGRWRGTEQNSFNRLEI